MTPRVKYPNLEGLGNAVEMGLFACWKNYLTY